MPVNYLPGKNLTLTVNAQVITAIAQPTLDSEAGEVDVTNLKSGGVFEGITDILKRTLNFECVMDANALLSFTEGSQVAASYVVASGHSYTGTFVLTKQSHKAGPRGAYTVTGTGFFTGAVTAA